MGLCGCRRGETVALDAPRDEGNTAEDARGTTEVLRIVGVELDVAFAILDGLCNLIRFDLLDASSSSLLLLPSSFSSAIISVGASCTPETGVCTAADPGRLRFPPVASSPSGWPNQLNGAVTMFLMAPRKDEFCRVSFWAV